ncbi:MAG TPA: hypothetical protein VD969_24410 [Symbiobacteriaceae bacterium]|nr:hypothetical protein [Symbiobacteriaceae bacterium]
MSRTGLNLALLRARAQVRENDADPQSGGISRRHLFRLAGAAAVASQLLRTETARALPNSVEFVHGKGRAAFKLDGAERWSIDTRAFGGSPRLAVRQDRTAIRLELSGATFPGTSLPANMVCEATLSGSVTFTFALGSFTCKAPLPGWLAGEAAAVGLAALSHNACALGDMGQLTLDGSAKAQFFPDWAFRLEGSAIARLSGAGREDLVSDSVSIALIGSDQPSLLANSADRRTLISLGRRDRVWALELAQLAPAGWELESVDHPFDMIHIETSISRRGEVRQALAAEAGTDDGRLNLVALSGLTSTDGDPFRLPLTSVRYAQTFDQQGVQTALVGRFSPEPVWLHARGCSMLLGDSPSAPGLELVQRNGQFTRSVCSPALLGLTSPMEQTIVEPRFVGGAGLVSLAATNAETQLPPLQDGPSEVPPRNKPRRREVDELDLPVIIAPLNLTLSVLRPEDLLVLTFEFVNLRLEAGGTGPARLVRQQQNRAAYMIVKFPPQAIGERAFYETETPGSPGDEPPTMPPVQNRISGPSRLVFRLPAGVNEIPYSMEALLSWTKYDHALVPAALPPSLLLPIRRATDLRLSLFDLEDDCNCEPLTPALIPPPRIQLPEEYHTAIEAPYRVFLSPNKYAGWAHSIKPVTHDGWTELWHTRLGVKGNHNTVDEESAYLRTVRAIWSPDFSPSGPPNPPDTSPFRMSLTTSYRNQIVRLSSDYQISGFSPRPIQADRLMLSSLGAWLNVRGLWSRRPPGFTVEEWRHRAVMARDTYVRVVEPGYLFPFGQRAALITVTERKFQPTPAGHMAAYLRQRKFIMVRQPERTFPATGQAYSGRQMPFKKVTVTTLVTPALDLPTPIVPGSGESSFWPRVGNKDFLFNVVTVDGEGQSQEFSTPMAFIKDDIADDAAKMTTVANNMANGDSSRRQRDLRGQKVAYAPADKPGDTSFETATMTFMGEVPDQSTALGADAPRFFPAMAEAGIRMASVDALTQSAAPAKIKMAQAFLDNAFEKSVNKTAVFAELVNTVAANFPTNMSGGVGTPNMGVSGLSRSMGPVGGALSDLVDGTFNPKQFFSDQAKILGGILLSDILDLLHLTDSDQKNAKVPKFTARVAYPKGPDGKEDKDAVPLGVEIKLEWKPDVKDDPLHIFVTNSNTKFELLATLFQDFNGNPPKFEVKGLLEDFKVDLIAPVTSFLILTFDKITFTATDGTKPDVDPKIDKVEFVGPLKFVQTLQDFLKSDGGGGPFSFSIDVSPTGVNAGVSLAIPSVQLGVLSIANMKLSMGLNLPFSGDPVRLRFAFCERENPFTITVSLFGGGGFFAVGLGLDGIELLEASFEFGGNFSMDIGVASGGVHIMVGIYYKMEGDDAELTGYVRLGGHLSVLGLITISAEFSMSLTYDIPKDKVWGQATLTVKIEILFFSISVDLHVERKFKGSAGDPTFADLMERSDWESYAEAFA